MLKKMADLTRLYTKLFNALSNDGYFILTDYFSLSYEEENNHVKEYIEIKKQNGINDDEFYHFDIPLTVENEIEALLTSGFNRVELLGNWGATYTLKANK